ncbi:MAG: SMP-30/gluconolactonase/LRE family protein [Acidobacteriota bacterium]|nr:SMP-30/gluconolactonase/LRE family protein [Acidobacteriota bacterium]MDE3146295.1 SMP-30/gluconolactonase/LRE family protein [Acidobacteriota bacterium]
MSEYVEDALDLATIATDLDHAEGVCWDPDRGCLWAGGEAGQIYSITPDGNVEVTHQIEGATLLGVALDAAGVLYACDVGHHTVWRLDHRGAPTRYGPAIDYPNYAAFGPDGTLYVSDSGSFLEPTGSIVAISPDASSRRLDLPAVQYANGLSVYAGHLYYVASSLPGVWRVDLNGGAPELVVRLSRCVPDGLAFDVEGNLYVSCYQPNQVWRLRASGELELLIDDWTGEFVLSPTNVAFYGDRLDRLALVSLCGHSLSSVDVGVRGAPVIRPTIKE